ncbi:hypothetical protein D3C87_1232390 [compost metagenome]
MIYVKQNNNEMWTRIERDKDVEHFWDHVGAMQPLLVETQAEYDWLFSMQLMIGREFVILLDGRDENTLGVPPTYVKIDIPL